MRIPSRTTGVIAVVLVATIALGVAWQFYQARQPDIDAVGGTILVYQLDRRPNNAVGKNNAEDVDTAAMAEVLERRLAYDGLRHVKVRPGGADQVEVLIPRVGDHQADVQSIKAMVARVGRLEFRVLANSIDDRQAIELAQHMVNHEREDDGKLQREFEDAQRDGLPPPGPREAEGRLRKFDLTLARGLKSTVTYSWVELAEPQRRFFNLDNAARDDPQRAAAWKEVATRRGQALQVPEFFVPAGLQAGFLLQGALFYSRECKDRNLPEQERGQKGVDYFVLARDPEFDAATGERRPAVDGSYLASAYADRDATGRLIIGFTFNAAGADLFGTLTRKNVSGPGAAGARDAPLPGHHPGRPGDVRSDHQLGDPWTRHHLRLIHGPAGCRDGQHPPGRHITRRAAAAARARNGGGGRARPVSRFLTPLHQYQSQGGNSCSFLCHPSRINLNRPNRRARPQTPTRRRTTTRPA